MADALSAAAAEASGDETMLVTLVDEQGEPVELTGLVPSGDQMALLMGSLNRGQSAQISATIDMIEDVFPDDSPALLQRVRNRRDPLTFEVLVEGIVGAISDFHSRQQLASTRTQASTGPRSTGRVRSTGSNRSG